MIREPIPSPEPIEVTQDFADAVLARFWRLEPILSLEEAGALIGISSSGLRYRISHGDLDVEIIATEGNQKGIRRSDMLAYIANQQQQLAEAVNALRQAA